MTFRKFTFLFAVVAIAAAAALAGMRDAATSSEIAYVTEEEGGISEIDLSTMKVIRRVQPSGIAPRGLAVTFDGKYVITSNKDTSDIAIFSTPQLDLVKRIHIGDNPEFIKIDPSGSRLLLPTNPVRRAVLRAQQKSPQKDPTREPRKPTPVKPKAKMTKLMTKLKIKTATMKTVRPRRLPRSM